MGTTIETFRSSVNTWECDENDHLNVQFYARYFDEAARHFALSAKGGGSASALPSMRHIRYHSELRVPASMDVRSAVIADGDFAGHVVHFMRETQTGKLSATALDAPSGLLYDAFVSEEEARPALPRGIAGKSLTPLTPDEMLQRGGLVSYRGVVWPGDCDERGFMTEQRYIGRASDAAPHAWAHAGMAQQWFDEKQYGRIAAEAKICRHNEARSGDLLMIHSHLRRAGQRSLRLRHEMTRATDSAPVATIEVMGLILDFRSRRTANLPEPLASQPIE